MYAFFLLKWCAQVFNNPSKLLFNAKREWNLQSYERNALLTFMNPCMIITAVTAGHWLGVGKICTTPAYESFIWMLFGLL